jgi:phage minor structural protein
MIPILYDRNETAFTSMGLGSLADAVRCVVTEERNGLYELELDYPVTGRLYGELAEGRIITARHDDAGDLQPFRIYAHSAPMDGLVTFRARHLAYDLGGIVLKPFTAGSLTEAFQKIQTQAVSTNPFTFWTDKAVTADYTIAAPVAVWEMLGGREGSILDVYGTGEYEFDGWTVKLHLHRGSDKGVTIRRGKNLTDIEQELDTSGTYNAVVPYWYDEDTGTLVTLPEEYVARTGATDLTYFALDLSDDFDEAPTEAQLRSAAESYLTNNEPWTPEENVKISFVALWQTPEYERVAVLERVGLCDTVTVFDEILGVSVKTKVVKVVYDALLERYEEMELGTPKTSFAQLLTEQTEEILDQVPTQSWMEAAIDAATAAITGQHGGNVVINKDANNRPYEILVMDSDDKATAVNVWRFNLAGLGHSSTGYNGPFSDIALTADGRINAAMITTGILNAAVIRAGIISDAAGLNSWNLDTGELHLGFGADLSGVGDYQDLVNTVAENKTDAESAADALQEQVDANKAAADSSIGELQDTVAPIASWVQVKADEITGQAYLEIGGSDGLRTVLNSGKLSFYQGDTEVAYISNETLYITKGEFITSVRIGRFAFIPRANGNLSFMRVE